MSNPAFEIHGCDYNMRSRLRRLAAAEYSNSMPGSQETNMARTFAGIVLSGKREPKWGEQALKTQQVLDACLQSAREGGKMVVPGEP